MAQLHRLPVEYEPDCFASPAGQWLPDFGSDMLSDGDERPFRSFTEVKPVGPLLESADMIAHVDGILRRMTIAWASRPDALLELVFWSYGSRYPALHVFSPCQGSDWWTWSQDPGAPAVMWAGMDQYGRHGIEAQWYHRGPCCDDGECMVLNADADPHPGEIHIPLTAQQGSY